MKKTAKQKAEDLVQRAPLEWTELVGYRDHVERLAALYARGRFPQVLLIEGREGQGKRLFAAALAALHFCVTGRACGGCSACLAVMDWDQPELLWIEKEGQSLKVEEAAELQQHLELRPSAFNWPREALTLGGEPRRLARLAVVVDVDRLTDQAANRLLKTLEEPNEDARIIMTTSRVGALLPTVLSRTVRWRVEPPPLEASFSWLKTRLPAEGLSGLPEARLERALQLSGLAPGKALRRLMAEAASEGDEIDRVVGLLFFSADPQSALERAEELQRRHGLGANDLAHRAEVILNQYYKYRSGLARSAGPLATVLGDRHREPSLATIAKWRELLREVKALAGRGRVPLNTQLTAEALAFAK